MPLSRRSARGRRRVPTGAPFIITSMLDMFTILLVFLLNFLDPANSFDPEVALPMAAVDAVAADGTVLTVTPDRVVLDGQEVLRLVHGQLPDGLVRTERRIDALYERLGAAARARDVSAGTASGSASNLPLSVHCDRSVPFSVLGELLYTAGQAGFGPFRFVVISAAG